MSNDSRSVTPSTDPTVSEILEHKPFRDGASSFPQGAQPRDEQTRPRQHHPSELEEADLAHYFEASGPIARALDTYEVRPSQVEMAQLVKEAILDRTTALIEAPTGTGKSLAYLLPALLSGRTVIIATANKSLQNQLYRKDIPFLAQVLGRTINAVMVKGRSNYLCTHKWEKEEPVQRQYALHEGRDEQVTYLMEWVNETTTGDIDDLPFELNLNIRPQVVSYPDDCLQRDCRHYFDNCFVNHMRDQAANAQILITNHHLLLNALELGEMGTRLLPEASIYIVDEAHQLESTATSVFEVEVTNYSLEQLLARSIFKEHVESETLDKLREQNTLAFLEAEHLSDDSSFRISADLEGMQMLGRRLKTLQEQLRQDHPYRDGIDEVKRDRDDAESEARARYDLALEALGSLSRKLKVIGSSERDEGMVRYAERIRDRRHVRLSIHAAPIDPAAHLRELLFSREPLNEDESPRRSVICTSATLATNGHFEHFKHRCGIVGEPIERVLPAVFDYTQQAMLYQPPLAAYNWRQRERYYDAVVEEIMRLLEVSRGRALCLFTNWSGLQQVHDQLSDPERGCVWPVQAQGTSSRNELIDWFLRTPYSVLLATRSFWEGVDLPGEDLSLVVLDKLPFPTPNDPIHSARMARLDAAEGGNSFSGYMLPLMTLTLKQGFGRLIRRSSDAGVVAILDERLSSKAYGHQSRSDLPDARYTRRFSDVHEFYRRAQNQRVRTEPDYGLNVRAWRQNDKLCWRWHLWRLQDGKSDTGAGWFKEGSLKEAEVTAAVAGLVDLKQRIERAGRSASSFGVELRCSSAVRAALDSGRITGRLAELWADGSREWGSLEVLGVV